MPTNKSPGMDGLTVEFYRAFWRLTGLVLWEPELRLVLSAYADDVLLVVQDLGDLAWVEACQAIYSAASSARVNWVKSSGLAIGLQLQTDPVGLKLKRQETPFFDTCWSGYNMKQKCQNAMKMDFLVLFPPPGRGRKER
ncbi:unnamed protein product [Caretta caretta]